MASDASGDRPFVGRAAERGALDAHMTAAGDGDGRVVLVTGEPGVGKTRLVEETVAGCASGRVLWGHCHEAEGAPAFWPWMQALRAHVRSTTPERLRRELGDDTAVLARLVPAIRTHAPDADETDGEEGDPEVARFRLFDAVAMWLRTIAADELLVVVLDDLHWADDESLLLLGFVARAVRDARLLVLGTYREAEPGRTAVAVRALGELGRTAHRLALDGLGADDLGAYVRAVYGVVPAGETLGAVHRATGGNAFFVTEVLELLHAKGQLDATTPSSGRLDIPDGAREVIRRRLQLLPDVGRRALEAGAVVGRDFDVAVLGRMTGLPDAEAILPELAVATQLGLVDELRDHAGTF